MLTAIPILMVLLTPVVILAGAMLAVEARQRARADVAARQIMLTDAVHAELGAIVSPVVEKQAFRPWRVVFALPDGRAREMGQLMAITERVLGARLTRSDELHIVFTRSAQAPRAAAA